jgi:hypothetical protein
MRRRGRAGERGRVLLAEPYVEKALAGKSTRDAWDVLRCSNWSMMSVGTG